MTPPLLSERLTQLRASLGAESLAPDGWSRPQVAAAAHVAPEALTQLETTGAGDATSLAALLHFYQSLGFNLAWVLTPDNAHIPRQAFRDILEETSLRQAAEPLHALHRLLQPAAVALEAGQPPTLAAGRTLLEQVQRGIHQALGQLLPPRRLVLSAPDLREYQRRLPPVRAAAAGWRSAALYVTPYHYYEAGASVPRCGDPVYYLTYDPGLEWVSATHKCLACRAHLGEDGVRPEWAAPPAGGRPDRQELL